AFTATPSWRYPAGYAYLDDADSGGRLLVTAAHRAITSTGSVGEAIFRQTTGLNTYVGITLLIPASDSAPTAPDNAPWAPGRRPGYLHPWACPCATRRPLARPRRRPSPRWRPPGVWGFTGKRCMPC